MSATVHPTATTSHHTRGIFEQTLRRRACSVTAVVVAFVVLAPAIVLAMPLLLVADVVRAKWSLPLARIATFALWYLAWEVVAVCSAASLWLASGFGRTLGSPASLRAHSRLQASWVTSLLAAGRRILRLDLVIEGADTLSRGPLIVLCRHASMVDTLVPAKLLFDHGMRVRYVLKDELLWDPALDIIGHRLPNYFVDRSNPDVASEVEAIGALAAGAGDDEAVVIFPEGTRWSPEKRERAIEHLRGTDPERAARAEQLTATMPPRPRGTLAILNGLPHADVVIMSHTGLEGLAGPGDALRLLPLRRPVQVSLRRIPRELVPTDQAERAEWLLDQWDQVDDWIVEHRR